MKGKNDTALAQVQFVQTIRSQTLIQLLWRFCTELSTQLLKNCQRINWAVVMQMRVRKVLKVTSRN
jgi:hypothetical protein